MTRNVLKISVSVLALSAMVGSAMAGGYGRGSANLDPLLGDNTTFTGSGTYVAPTRKYTSVNGVATTGAGTKDFAADYFSVGATASFKFNDAMRCAASFAQPFGADSDYGSAQIVNGLGSTTAASLETTELGATCSYGMTAGPGTAFVIGGIFSQSASYTETKGTIIGGNLVDGIAGIALDHAALGFRMGLGYAIPEVALKASLVYRSAVTHNFTGVQFLSGTAATGAVLGNAGLTPGQFAALAGGNAQQKATFAALNNAITGLTGNYNTYANAITPQSVKFAFQTGIAEGTLMFGSLEWTDWSVLQQVKVLGAGSGTAAAAAGFNGTPTPGAPTIDAFFKDGWTANLGFGRKFTEQLSGAVSYTWDQGVSTGRSGFGTTHTFSLGAIYNVNENTTLRGGLAYTVLGAATELTSAGKTVVYGQSSAVAGGVSFTGKF